MESVRTTFYKNGKPEWVIPIEFHVPGKYRLHGEAIQYYPTGEKKISQVNERGATVSETHYYRDGKVRLYLPFEVEETDGKRSFHKNGKAKYYDESGELDTEVEYKKGKMVGKPNKVKVKKHE